MLGGRSAWVSFGWCAVFVLGCHNPRVVTPVGRHRAFDAGRAVTLIFPSLVSDLPGKARTPRYAELPRRLVDLFGGRSTTAIEERDVTGPPPLDSWVVRVQLMEIHSGRSLDETELEFELSVYDASGAPVERVATDAGIVLMVDTSSRTHVLRERFEVTVETRDGSWLSGGPAAEAFEDRFSEVLAAQLYAAAARSIGEAIRSAVPRVQAVEVTGPVVAPVEH